MSRAVYCSTCQTLQPLDVLPLPGQVRWRCRSCGCPVDVDDAYAAAGARQATVLCIDDDRLVLGVCANALEAYGFRVVIATNGRTGLEIARRERPDLVFLDILMPGSDGLDVCRQLRATPECRDTPVVLLTASTDAALSEAGVEAGAALVMRKPFGPDVIVATAYKVLAHRRAPRTT